MGHYITRADVIGRFGSELEVAYLTDSEDTGLADPAVLDEVIGKGEGDIDTKAGVKHRVPLDVAGDAVMANWVKSAALDLVVSYLHSRSGNVPQPVADDRDWVRKQLDEIAKGTRVLPSGRTEVSTVSRDPVSSWGTAGTGDSSKRVFSRATQEQL